MKEFLVVCLFSTVCGWTGNIVVRVLSLGKINLNWGTDSESYLTEAIGLIFLLLIGILISWILE